nr:hypothetical protein [uncultured Rhodopila sp.]
MQGNTAGARIFNSADYRRPKPKTKPPASAAAVPALMPEFCGSGWFNLPVLMPMMVSSEFHA